jgi:class 3 adenylate cyclase/predicted ATPase
MAFAGASVPAAGLERYVSRLLLRRLATAPENGPEVIDATVVFVDVSGFTRLSERLLRAGKEGAELLTDAINASFTALLTGAWDHGGSLVKFGGDALLVWFEGEDHAARACSAAVAMRNTLREAGRFSFGRSETVLRMSVGVHSGPFHNFLVGRRFHHLVIAGPAATEVVGLENAAASGQILVSAETARRIPARCLGASRGPGTLLARSPAAGWYEGFEVLALPAEATIAACLAPDVLAVVGPTPDPAEHRTATLAFLQYQGFDGLIATRGAEHASAALDELICLVQDAASEQQVCLLDSDIAADGGKLILSAGAPRAVGDEEERMLLALRRVVEAKPPLPVKIGVNRGPVFTGEVGPDYRRTYVVMGDTVNLAARVMAQAPPGRIYATEEVLRRSRTGFETAAVPPFSAKGKKHPVHASEVGEAHRAAPPGAAGPRPPLVGRDREVELLREAVDAARAGHGQLIELVGETGSGKSRLLSETRDVGEGMRFFHATCEPYTKGTPYVSWRDALRELIGLTWEDSDERVVARLREVLPRWDPELLPWLPLLAIVFDAEAPPTREVEELSPEFRVAKLHEVVIRFLSRALRVPTLVHVEHAHFMDDASGALLHALAAALPSSSWLVITTRRDVETGFVAGEETALRLELGPLPREQALALAESTEEAHQVPPHVLELAVERSGGSPEFLLDLLVAAASGSGELPDSVEAATSARLDALDPRDRVLVRRAAVLGLSFHPQRLADVLEPQMLEVQGGLWDRLGGVFSVDPDGHVRFKRPVVQEVAYSSLPFRLRRELHRRVADSLERDMGQDVDADPSVLSLHFMLAGDRAKAWTYALRGAERAVARFAHADAAALYRRAIDAGRASGVEPTELAAAWEELGEALRRVGERRAASDAFTAARRLFGDARVDLARLLYRHAVLAERSEGARPAVRWATRGLRMLEAVEGEEAASWRARLLADLAGFRQRQGRSGEAERLARRAMAEAEAIGEQRALARACYVLDWALVDLGRAAEALYSGRALEIYRQLGDLEQESAVLNNLGMFAYYRGAWDEAIDLYRQQADCSKRSGDPANVAYTDCNIGEILSDQGHLEEAAVHLKRARRVWKSTGDAPGVAFADLLLGRAAVREGRYAEGLEVLRDGAARMHRSKLEVYAEFADALVAEAEAFGGEPERALAAADSLLLNAQRNAPLLRRVKGVALARLGRLSAAKRELQAASLLAQETENSYEAAAAFDLLSGFGESPVELSVKKLGIERLPRPLGWEEITARQTPPDARVDLVSTR